jgi:uncharacterized membrane protein YkoI
MTKRLALILALASATLAPPALALAQASPPPDNDSLGADYSLQQDAARAAVKQGRYLPLSRIIAEIHRQNPGRELDAGLEQAGARAVYRVRWAGRDGRRIDYIVDAQTGAILSAK